MTEEEIFSGSSEEDLIDRTWKKLERDLRKEGFREGALKGQEEAYQSGFDLGYAEGYRLGEVLGFHQGNLCLLKHLSVEKCGITHWKGVIDENEKGKACILCSHENLLLNNIDDVLVSQRKMNDVIISKFDCGS